MEGKSTGCMYNYVVTAHKPTGVTHSAVGHFTSATELNLVVAKTTRLEIYTLGDGLQRMPHDIPIYGRIAIMQLFRPKNETKDRLFICTDRCKFCVLEYDNGEVVTRANGDVSDKNGRPCEAGQLGRIDPEARMIALHIYAFRLKIIPLNQKGELQEAFNINMEELNVLDIQFLHSSPKPTIALLYEDTNDNRHIKSYVISQKDKDMTNGPLGHEQLDPGAVMLAPVPAPLGGVLALGQNAIQYFHPNKPQRSVPVRQQLSSAVDCIDDDGKRWLLGDSDGQLYLLVLQHEQQQVQALKLEPLGHVAPPKTLSYVDEGLVFVGSWGADSQLVRLHSERRAETGEYVEVLDTQVGLGPIQDMAVVDLDRHGQGQVVLCSGLNAFGSLRIVRNGVAINEQANVELQGIKGVWGLRSSWMDAYDKWLVLSFVNETRVLAMNEDDELAEDIVEGLDSEQHSLLCSNTMYDDIVQVTRHGVRLVDCSDRRLVSEWKPPDGVTITSAAASPSQLLLALGGGRLQYLELWEHQINPATTTTLDAEVACVDISPIEEDGTSSLLAAVGTWSREVVLLQLPTLTPLVRESLSPDVIPRSALLSPLDSTPYLMVGMGDGQLLSWRLTAPGPDAVPGSSAPVLTDRKAVSLGTKHLLLRAFSANGSRHVFGASDRPAIIYSQNKKLMYSNLNEAGVNFMASFNSAMFPDSLAIAKEGSLLIGMLDEIQKLHIRSVPLHCQPRRIAHQPATNTYAVATVQGRIGTSSRAAHLRILDATTFDQLATFDLDKTEEPDSLASLTLGEDPRPLFVMGSCCVLPEEVEPSRGCITVLHFHDGKLTVLARVEVPGMVLNVMPFQGKLLASVAARVQIMTWGRGADDRERLETECSFNGRTISVKLAARGDFILVGDLSFSATVLLYRAEEKRLELRSRDFDQQWVTAVEVLDDDTFLLAQNLGSLLVLRKNAEGSDEEMGRLEVVGRYGYGDLVNVLRHGSLAIRLPDSELATVPLLLLGGCSGALCVMASLPHHLFDLLQRLQAAMRKVLVGVGGQKHSEWRSTQEMLKPGFEECLNFVDGDLVEGFLDLPRSVADNVLAQMSPAGGSSATFEDVTRRVEEISRLH